jgi:hypothetical protein
MLANICVEAAGFSLTLVREERFMDSRSAWPTQNDLAAKVRDAANALGDADTVDGSPPALARGRRHLARGPGGGDPRARYGRHLRGAWRAVYVVCAALALYLNVFVGVVQAFMKVSPLHALAPQQTEPPFRVAQLVVLALFIVVTIVAARRFRIDSTAHV